jgi:hypothetical protein
MTRAHSTCTVRMANDIPILHRPLANTVCTEQKYIAHLIFFFFVETISKKSQILITCKKMLYRGGDMMVAKVTCVYFVKYEKSAKVNLCEILLNIAKVLRHHFVGWI